MQKHPSSDVGSAIVAKIGAGPHTAAGTVNGSAIDRQGKDSCVLVATSGAATGTPTSFTYDSKLQQSDDGSTGWADISGAAVAQITADATQKSVNVDLTGAKRYIRAVDVVAFVGGTSPTLPSGSVVVLGGSEVEPAT
jgi:hypothetical protein